MAADVLVRQGAKASATVNTDLDKPGQLDPCKSRGNAYDTHAQDFIFTLRCWL